MGKAQNKEVIQEDLYQALLRCGAQHSPYDFCGQIVKELYTFVPYEQARILFLDISGKIYGSLLFGVNKRHWENFMNYYDNDLVTSKYSLKKPQKLSENEKVCLRDWRDISQQSNHNLPFVEDYVRSLNLNYSLGFCLSDQDNCIRCVISLDRTSDIPYSQSEIQFIRKLRPLLENYFINLLLPAPDDFCTTSFLGNQYTLTRREREIVKLLTDGMTPASISQRLSVSISTIYKHIANIYQKCGISNRQELYQLFG